MIEEQYSVKQDDLEDSAKYGKKQKIHYCPYCGNEMHVKINGNHVFCDKCHRRMPWTIMKTDDTPIKECKI